MAFVLDQLLLVASVGALGSAGWQVAGPAVDGGLLRLLAAAAVAASAALVSAVALGLFGLGANPAALFVVALALWVAARAVFRSSGSRASERLADWWSRLPLWGRAARCALLGAAIGYLVWVLRHPAVGVDALADHLALPVDWVHNGAPGSLVSVNVAIPFQNFPIAHEVLVGWVIGISRTLSAAMLVTPATLVLLAVSVRAGLDEVGVPPPISWLAVATMASVPILVAQLGGPNNDLPATAWLGCAAALVAGCRRTPRLLPFAVLAAGLAVGTKTTTIPLVVLVLLIGVIGLRSQLRPLTLPLAVACGVAIVTGALWYLRDLIDHGAPLWPVSSFPGGDPVPPALAAIDPTFLGHIGATLHGRVGDYGKALAGGLVALVAALASPLWARHRAASGAALAVAVAVVIWAASPYSGNWNNTTLALGATRYLLPALLAATVTLATSALRRRWPAALALGIALAVNLDRDWTLKFPAAPGPGVLIVAGVIAVVAVLAMELAVRAVPRSLSLARSRAAPLVMSAAAGAMLVALVAPAGGFMGRHAGTRGADAGLVRWLDSRAAFAEGHEPVLVGPAGLAVLTGARLGHRVVVPPERQSCRSVSAALRDSWLVLERSRASAIYYGRWLGCLRGRAPAYLDQSYVAFAPPRLRTAREVLAGAKTR